ncbi:sporulation protein YqfD [Paenibacillus thailandensis]|uniref:Sporulation protein YqfD n=1 Tax=Paenibacillus thailandensis TaxID=393250 RepID=A0ABW5R1B1_9BACL
MQWMQWTKGVVSVHIRGEEPEQLVNRALAGGLELWNIRWTSGGSMAFDLSVGDFFRLRPYLRKTGCRVHVVKRAGLPFWMARAGKRKFFAAGMFLFFVIIYLLSSLVWSVEISGNKRITDEQIEQAAKEEGLYPMQWSFRLAQTDVLAKRLAGKLPDAAWVGVEKEGTRVIIKVVETTQEQKPELNTPRHLVASADAVVTQILAEKGRAVVSKNQRVKRGQTLISGTIGAGENTQTVVAKGTVRGLVWYEYNIVSPLTQTYKVYTGEKETKWYAVIGSRMLQVSGFGKSAFELSEAIRTEEQAGWRDWKLPIGRMKETVMEVVQEERKLTAEEAREVGLLQAKAELTVKAGADAVVRDEIILHEKTDNGKVYMKVLFEVEQSIIEEMPLVHVQGD